MEAIEFFVTGFEFGLSSTMIGIRRMLPLIWSKETGIKEAVVAAYKRLYLNPQGGNARYVMDLSQQQFNLYIFCAINENEFVLKP